MKCFKTLDDIKMNENTKKIIKNIAIVWVKRWCRPFKLKSVREIVRIINKHKKNWSYEYTEFSNEELCSKADLVEMFVRFFNIKEKDIN